MRLYLDDATADRRLVALLTHAGHVVVVPARMQLSGAPDTRPFIHAMRQALVLVTRNHDDFLDKKASFVRPALHDGCPDMITHPLLISPAIIYIHSRFLGTTGMVQTMRTGNFS